MNRTPPWRPVLALLCLLLMPLCAWWLDRPVSASRAADTCLGVTILSQAAYDALTLAPADGDIALYGGRTPARDRASNTLYLSVRVPSSSQPCELEGTLRAASRAGRLAFAPDEAFARLSDAVAEGHAFTLLSLDGKGHARACRVILTPLTVVELLSDDPENDDPYAEHTGRVRITEPGGTRQTDATWHRRGMTTRLYKKASLKLSMKKPLGHARNVAIAGLGSDDDWILNSMGMDDLRLRELLLQRLWNAEAASADTLPMSAGAYAEVVIDGEYRGLYLLQRRVDAQYLQLNTARDILLKGSNVLKPRRAAQAYTIRSSPLADAETLALAETLFTLSDPSLIDLNSWLTMDVFSLFAGLYDNLSFKNAYYLLAPEANGYAVSFLPWDTDVAFGLDYVPGEGYLLLPTDEDAPVLHRREYDALLSLYPDLDARLAKRWRALRAGTLSDTALRDTLESILHTLHQSGALARDQALWGVLRDGEDTVERMEAFLTRRLRQLDRLYGIEEPQHSFP